MGTDTASEGKKTIEKNEMGDSIWDWKKEAKGGARFELTDGMYRPKVLLGFGTALLCWWRTRHLQLEYSILPFAESTWWHSFWLPYGLVHQSHLEGGPWDRFWVGQYHFNKIMYSANNCEPKNNCIMTVISYMRRQCRWIFPTSTDTAGQSEEEVFPQLWK